MLPLWSGQQRARHRRQTYPTMGIDNQGKAIEAANSVDARGADFKLAILDKPKLEVPIASVLTIGPELKLKIPFRFVKPGSGHQKTIAMY